MMLVPWLQPRTSPLITFDYNYIYPPGLHHTDYNLHSTIHTVFLNKLQISSFAKTKLSAKIYNKWLPLLIWTLLAEYKNEIYWSIFSLQ